MNGATVKSEENEPEGSKAPESDASEPSGATEPSENESSTKTGTTVSITSSLDGKLEAGTSGNDAQSNEDNPDSNDFEHSNDVSQHNDDDSKHSDDDSEPSADDSEPSKDDSELNNSTNTDDSLQVIDQFQNQDFSKGTTLPKEDSATGGSMTFAEEGQGSLYLGSSSDESSGADVGLQVEDQEQQQEEQEEGGEEIEETRSLLSRWWLWLLMLCLGLGLGLLCKARINAKQGEAEYLRMGERHQGSTITIPR